MKIYITRCVVQALVFLLLIYGAYLGLRFSNFMPLWRCPHQNSYSEGCYLLPFHRTQYGHSVYPQENRGMPFPGYLILQKGEAYFRFFLFLIIAVAVVNKVWCGWFCPFGTLQDFVHYIKRKFKFREISFSRKAKYIIQPFKYIFLLLFFSAFVLLILGGPVTEPLFCKMCPAKAFLLPLEGNLLNFSIQFPHDTVASVLSCVIAGFVLAAIFLKRRFFCFICPIKALIHLLNLKLFWRLRKNPAGCNFCGRCEKVCPMGTKDIWLEKKARTISPQYCNFCLRCIDECSQRGVIEAEIFKRPD